MKTSFALLFALLALFASSIEAFKFKFTGNSAVMYEQVCLATPFFVRKFTRNAILQEIERQGHQEVTESAFYQVIQQVTPKTFLAKTLEILDQHKAN